MINIIGVTRCTFFTTKNGLLDIIHLEIFYGKNKSKDPYFGSTLFTTNDTIYVLKFLRHKIMLKVKRLVKKRRSVESHLEPINSAAID